MKRFIAIPAVAALFIGSAFAQGNSWKMEQSPAVKHDLSIPLREMPRIERTEHPNREHPVKPLPQQAAGGPDAAVQSQQGLAVATGTVTSFPGVGNGDYGFSPDAAPPDTNGSVGSTQYVQWVNESFAVFSKATGSLVAGPYAGNTLWKGFGGGCETNNDGDPIVQYDKAANRWIMTQFSVSTKPYLQCVAVSTTADATGSYNRYSFSYGTGFNDYPKLGVWPDAYYITFNIFTNGSSFAGGKVCAYDRAAMIAGSAATQQCFQLSTSFGGLLPSDLDGGITPPTGAAAYIANFGSNSLNFWRFHVDWTTPANTTLTGPVNVPVAAFTAACGGGSCVPQSGTNEKLDSLADRLMYRLAYRHFADGHEALVVNHSVKTGGTKRAEIDGVRWYEIRPNGTGYTVAQQSTFSPDSNSRWMGSIAMDKVGNMAMGYSVSSGSMHPAIRFTGRLSTDAANTMQAETSAIQGNGSQLSNLNRWGDYSNISVDPADDCTLWYTTEYIKANGTFNWSTYISHFKFPSCK